MSSSKRFAKGRAIANCRECVCGQGILRVYTDKVDDPLARLSIIIRLCSLIFVTWTVLSLRAYARIRGVKVVNSIRPDPPRPRRSNTKLPFCEHSPSYFALTRIEADPKRTED